VNGVELVVVGTPDLGCEPFKARLVEPLELERAAHVLILSPLTTQNRRP
jgi:hypothetical protein